MVNLKPEVSIIIPTYNMAATLPRALVSAMSQSHGNLEIIVVDDGSKDNTRDVVRTVGGNDGRVRYIFQPHRCKPVAVNNGLTNSRGDFIALLDADDTLTEHSIESRLRFLEKNPGLNAVFADTNYMNGDGKAYAVKRPPANRSNPELGLMFLSSSRIPFHAMSLMYRWEVFSEIGRFDESLRRAEDADFVFRLFNACEVGYLPDVVYNYNVTTHSAPERLANRLIGTFDKLAVIRKHTAGARRIGLSASTIGIHALKFIYEAFSYRK